METFKKLYNEVINNNEKVVIQGTENPSIGGYRIDHRYILFSKNDGRLYISGGKVIEEGEALVVNPQQVIFDIVNECQDLKVKVVLKINLNELNLRREVININIYNIKVIS